MKERWVELKGNREIYMIGSNGNVKTKDREGARGHRVDGHILKQHENSNGYLRVSMRLDGDEKNKNYLVHRLVAKSFIPEVDGKPFVNHKDGDKHNNTVENLEWCNKSENEKHAWKIGLKKDIATKGERHGMHKLSENDVLYIRKNHKRNGGKLKTGDLAKQFSVNPQTITDIISNRIWKSIL